MKPRYDVIVSNALDRAIPGAIVRFYKHRDDGPPGDGDLESLSDAIADAVLNELCEWFKFDEE